MYLSSTLSRDHLFSVDGSFWHYRSRNSQRNLKYRQYSNTNVVITFRYDHSLPGHYKSTWISEYIYTHPRSPKKENAYEHPRKRSLSLVKENSDDKGLPENWFTRPRTLAFLTSVLKELDITVFVAYCKTVCCAVLSLK